MFATHTIYSAPPPVTPKWSVVTAGTALPVNLDKVKTFIHRPLEDTFWDTELTGFVRIATREIEKHLQMDLVQSTFRASLPYFTENIRINRRPFQSISKIDYVAPDGTITTVPSTLYHAMPIAQECGAIFLADRQQWPEIASRWDAVRIDVVAGYASGQLPPDIEHALLMTVAAMDSKRGDQQEQGGSDVTVYAMKQAKGNSLIPVEARALISQYRLQTLTLA